MTLHGLYGMVDRADANADGALALAAALVDGGARIVQLRMKGADAAAQLAVARVLAPWCRARGVVFIVNDRVDVARAAGADGVHLGQDDLPLAAARAIAPPGFVIGVSTHDEPQARAAIAGGADYIGFGPCFATQSKTNPDPIVGCERLARVCAFATVPVVAIGGITLETVSEVVRAGASAAAIIRAVNGATDVTAAARVVSAACGQTAG
ncbi:MAG: thiamine phosphate synthase [Polyangia bacterium]